MWGDLVATCGVSCAIGTAKLIIDADNWYPRGIDQISSHGCGCRSLLPRLLREVIRSFVFPRDRRDRVVATAAKRRSAYQVIRAPLRPEQRLFNPILRLTFVGEERNNRGGWLINFGSRERGRRVFAHSSVSNDACPRYCRPSHVIIKGS